MNWIAQVILRQVFEATEEALATPQRSPRPANTAPYPALPMLPYPSLPAGSASTSGAAHADESFGGISEGATHQQTSSSSGLHMSPTRMEHLSRRSLAAGEPLQLSTSVAKLRGSVGAYTLAVAPQGAKDLRFWERLQAHRNCCLKMLVDFAG